MSDGKFALAMVGFAVAYAVGFMVGEPIVRGTEPNQYIIIYHKAYKVLEVK